MYSLSGRPLALVAPLAEYGQAIEDLRYESSVFLLLFLNSAAYAMRFQIHELSHCVVGQNCFRVEYKRGPTVGGGVFSRGVKMNVSSIFIFVFNSSIFCVKEHSK